MNLANTPEELKQITQTYTPDKFILVKNKDGMVSLNHLDFDNLHFNKNLVGDQYLINLTEEDVNNFRSAGFTLTSSCSMYYEDTSFCECKKCSNCGKIIK